MGLSRMHVPAAHWLAGTLTLGGSDGVARQPVRLAEHESRSRESEPVESHRPSNPHRPSLEEDLRPHHHFHPLSPSSANSTAQRFRLNGTFERGYGSLARNDATFQNHKGQCLQRYASSCSVPNNAASGASPGTAAGLCLSSASYRLIFQYVRVSEPLCLDVFPVVSDPIHLSSPSTHQLCW